MWSKPTNSTGWCPSSCRAEGWGSETRTVAGLRSAVKQSPNTLRDPLTAGSVGALSPELDALLRQTARRQRLAKKELLFARGSAPDAMFCIERGLVRLCVTSASGREAVLGLVTPGHWFGEASVFSGQARAHDAFAVVQSDLLVLPAKTLHRLVDDRPEFLLQFLVLMGLRYKSTLDRMDGSVLDPLPVRLARKLLDVHTMENPHARQGLRVALDVSQEGLGHMLGVSRQSVNKVLKHWEGLGVLQVSYRSILLLDLKALKRLALHPQ